MGQLIICNETVMYWRLPVEGQRNMSRAGFTMAFVGGGKIGFLMRSHDQFGPGRYGVNQRKRLFSGEKMVGDVGIEPTTR